MLQPYKIPLTANNRDNEVIGQLEGDNFIITSDIESIIDNLRRNII